jgi:hypothetical protein
MTPVINSTERIEEILIALRCNCWVYSTFSPGDECIIAQAPTTPDYQVYFYIEKYEVSIWQTFSGGFVLTDIPIGKVGTALPLLAILIQAYDAIIDSSNA